MVQEGTELHRKQATQYLQNAAVLLQSGEAQKAAELLWGSMAHALKAVAARKGVQIRQHRELREFARALARELQDPAVWTAHTSAEYLHSDFYEVELSRDDVAAIGEQVREAVRRLLELASRPLPLS